MILIILYFIIIYNYFINYVQYITTDITDEIRIKTATN
jgi:hypothetical protein